MSTIQYRDYQGAVEFDGGKLLIRILHIDDLIATEVDSAADVEAAFAELVEDYLATCSEVGKEPGRPFKGLFNVRVPPELHKRAAFAAASEDATLNAYVISALEEKLTPLGAIRQPEDERAEWMFHGYLRLSLVTCPVKLLPATDENDLEFLQGERMIEISTFAKKGEIDPAYYAGSYYLVPDGPVGHDAYAVIREVMTATNAVGLASIGEHTFVVHSRGAGMVATLLRNADQVRDPSDLFAAINKAKITKDMIDLAKNIVDQKRAPFDPRNLKVAPQKRRNVAQGEPRVTLPVGGNVIDLIEALKKSRRQSATEKDSDTPRRKA
jgi:non-homologous end joining protein Ku/predicted HicB family RNase H-like nuclease